MSSELRRSTRTAQAIVRSPSEEDSENENGPSVESEDGDEGEEEKEEEVVGDEEDDESEEERDVHVGRAPVLKHYAGSPPSDMEVDEEEPEDDELSNSSAAPTAQSSRSGPIKVMLKLPTAPASSLSNTATPVAEEYKVSPSKRTSGRARRVIPEYNESSEAEDGKDDMDISDSSEEVTKLSPSKRLTSRQAVLANTADSIHISLSGDATPSGRASKKKQLNENELALRREETARKRKNMTEKKLEDEKAETINRLLKKQTRPRAKRGNGTGATATPRVDTSKADSGEEDVEVDETPVPVPEPEIPTMYRWISTSRPPAKSGEGAMDVEGEEGPTMSLIFAVPPNLLTEVTPQIEPKAKAICAVEGCWAARKYRLVNNFDLGACGMLHLKLLQT